MSIAPASDFLLDMARAAEPSRARAALARLSGDPSVSFARVLDEGGRAADARSSEADAARAAAAPRAPARLSPPAELEAYFLQNFIELVLPKDESLFGQGVAGESWRSMMAEHMARDLAAAGGIGLAAHFAKREASVSGEGASAT